MSTRVARGVSDVAGIIAATVLLVLLLLLFTRPGSFAADTITGYLGCVVFALLAGVSVAARARGAGGSVHPAELVAVVTLGALLPLVVVLGTWGFRLAGPFAVLPAFFLALPLLLSAAARGVIQRGRVARGTALLLAGQLYTAGLVALWAVALPVRLWLPAVSWHLLLAAAAVAALVRDERARRRVATAAPGPVRAA